MGEGATACIICLVGIGLLLLIILLPLSFTYFEYDEIGFLKNSITNNVEVEQAYTVGMHYTGLGFTTVTYERAQQRIDARLAIFPSNGQEFNLNVVAFFNLSLSDLPQVYDQFGTADIHGQAITRMETAIKSLSPQFTIEEYTTNRAAITKVFFDGIEEDGTNGVQGDLQNIGLTLPADKFWLAEIELPASVLDANLAAAVQNEVNQQEENEQEATLVTAETNRLYEEIIANLTFVNAQADADIQAINAEADASILQVEVEAAAFMSKNIKEANAEADMLLATADGIGLASLFASLNVTSVETKASFIRYFALRDSHAS